MRSFELQVCDSKARDLPYVERAFNVLAHADLRNCYDALCKNEDAAPLFPYGGVRPAPDVRHPFRYKEPFFPHPILVCKSGKKPSKVAPLLSPRAVLPGLAVFPEPPR